MARPKKGYSKNGIRIGRPPGTTKKKKKRAPPIGRVPPPEPPDPPVDPNLPPEECPLTPREMLFVSRYLFHDNATRAYQEVYQCSYSTANTAGPKLSQKPNVAREIQHTAQAVFKKLRLTNEDVVEELVRIALCDLGCVEDAYGNYLRLGQIPVQERRAIQSCKIKTRTIPIQGRPPITETSVEYKMHDKIGALELLASYLSIRKTGIPDFEAFLALMPSEARQQLKDILASALKDKEAREKASMNGHADILPSVSPPKAEVVLPEE